ncbi:MAG TPA: hypothetical protein VF747_01850, partial [Blastocatellia bacterium]
MTDRLTSEEEKEVIAERAPGEAVVEVLLPPAASQTGGSSEATGGDGAARARSRSPSQIVWLKLRRNRTAMFGLYTLVTLYAAAILAGFLAPYR